MSLLIRNAGVFFSIEGRLATWYKQYGTEKHTRIHRAHNALRRILAIPRQNQGDE